MKNLIVLLVVGLLLPWDAGQLAAAPRDDNAALVAQVMAAERGFARSMADRDFKTFQSFIADEAVFFNGPKALVGRAAVAEAWRGYFQPGPPPFAWAPDQVVVLARGNLGLSMGPVTDANGKVLARFNTVWQRQKNGRWQVVFDKGNAVCAEPPTVALGNATSGRRFDSVCGRTFESASG